jgi:hypothetical protein
MEHEKPIRRIRAGQPAPPILLDPVDTDDPPEELPDWVTGAFVVAIILVIAACAALVVRVI